MQRRERLTSLVRQRLQLLALTRHVGAPALALLIVGEFAIALAPAMTAVVTGILVARVVDAGATGGAAALVVGPVIALTALTIAQLGTDELLRPLEEWSALRINARIRELVRKVLGEPEGIEHLEDQRIRDLAALPIDDGEHSIGRGAQGQLWVLIRMLGALTAAGLIAAYKPWLAVFEFSLLFMSARHMRRIYASNLHIKLQEIGPQLRAAEYWNQILTSTDSAKELRVYAFAERALDAHQRNLRALVDVVAGILIPAMRKGWVSSVLAAAGLGVPFTVATRDAIDGRLDIGQFAVVLGAMMAVFQMSSGGSQAFAINAATARLASLRRLEELADATPVPAAPAPVADQPPLIEFDHVSFAYPGADQPVFNDLCLTILPGDSLALVGENGVGKTTLIKLLCGFYQPTAGQILVDGQPLAATSLVTWRRRLAVIFQDFARFHLTALENVALADLGHPDVRSLAARAAEAAGAADVVEGLPHGWETIMSREYTGGSDLSGGQWQRIALARALYAASVGGSVLILDEPTANLDVHAEVALFDQLLTHASGATTCVVSHRFSTVRRASRIVVIADGAVAEDGSHEALLALGGTYARLYTLQAAAFEDQLS